MTSFYLKVNKYKNEHVEIDALLLMTLTHVLFPRILLSSSTMYSSPHCNCSRVSLASSKISSLSFHDFDILKDLPISV